MQQVLRTILILVLLLLTGMTGYSLIEGWAPLEALYMSVITLSTVGFKEVHSLSSEGQLFTIAYLLVGLGVFLFEVAQFGEIIVRGQLREWLGKRRMDTRLRSMRNHFIVCGFGRFGRRLCEELEARKLPFVIVDKNPEALESCREVGWPCVDGDATEDETLLNAGIEHARGLAAVLSTDAENLYTVLSARLLAREIRVLSRAATEKDAEKLKKAGVDQVVSLYATGATKMAQLLANPNVGDFMEVISSKGEQLDLAEVRIHAESSCFGKPLAESDLRERGIIVVGIRRADGDLQLLPGGTDVPGEGDYIIALGRAGAIADLIRQG
jgi:voltage-gated potassium channel